MCPVKVSNLRHHALYRAGLSVAVVGVDGFSEPPPHEEASADFPLPVALVPGLPFVSAPGREAGHLISLLIVSTVRRPHHPLVQLHDLAPLGGDPCHYIEMRNGHRISVDPVEDCTFMQLIVNVCHSVCDLIGE